MKHLAKNETAFKEATRWKLDGPSDSFLALVDIAAVHSTCRLCIHLATQIRLKEEAAAPKRPCYCTSASGDIHHMYVRECGRFESVSIFINVQCLGYISCFNKLQDFVLPRLLRLVCGILIICGQSILMQNEHLKESVSMAWCVISHLCNVDEK